MAADTAEALDLALFINGLPIATFELKNSLTKQTVEDAVELPHDDYAEPHLPEELLTGGLDSYAACQAEARRLIARGAVGLRRTSFPMSDTSASPGAVDGGAVYRPERISDSPAP